MSTEPAGRSSGRWRLLRPDGSGRTGSLVQAADAFVARLRLPKQASYGDLQRAVEAIYGKPILLVASASPAMRTITGLWIDTAEFGAVVCREADAPHYQAQNAFHELAHVLFATAPDDWFSEPLPRPTPGEGGSPTLICANGDRFGRPSADEAAVEEVAFAMARAVQAVNRTTEEAYFG